MINATVSHELRNPLNSLIGQICSMDDFFESFSNLIEHTSDKLNKAKFDEINKGLRNCGKKIISAVKFIDFFVHDILDYTLLNKKDKNLH